MHNISFQQFLHTFKKCFLSIYLTQPIIFIAILFSLSNHKSTFLIPTFCTNFCVGSDGDKFTQPIPRYWCKIKFHKKSKLHKQDQRSKLRENDSRWPGIESEEHVSLAQDRRYSVIRDHRCCTKKPRLDHCCEDMKQKGCCARCRVNVRKDAK